MDDMMKKNEELFLSANTCGVLPDVFFFLDALKLF